MDIYLHRLSHTPLVGFVDPERAALDEVNGVIIDTRRWITAFDPKLVALFTPDYCNGFFHDAMLPFYLGTGTTATDDLANATGDLPVSTELVEACAHTVINNGISLAVSYNMRVDHDFAQQLGFLLGDLDRVPVLLVFINGAAAPLPGFQRVRLLGKVMDRFLNILNKRVLIPGSGGLSYQPSVPEPARADIYLRDRLLGSGKQLPPDEREWRQQRVINAARRSTEDQYSLHPLDPVRDNRFMSLLGQGWLAELDAIGDGELPAMAGKSTHEVKTWVVAFAALSIFDCWHSKGRYYRPILERIAGLGSLSVTTEI